MNSSDPHASMQLVEDLTMKEGELITPNTSFLKTWRIMNNGKALSSLGKREKISCSIIVGCMLFGKVTFKCLIVVPQLINF